MDALGDLLSNIVWWVGLCSTGYIVGGTLILAFRRLKRWLSTPPEGKRPGFLPPETHAQILDFPEHKSVRRG